MPDNDDELGRRHPYVIGGGVCRTRSVRPPLATADSTSTSLIPRTTRLSIGTATASPEWPRMRVIETGCYSTAFVKSESGNR
jgi:hypothetical protein